MWACSSSAIWAWRENTGTEGCWDPGVRSSGMPHPIFGATLPVLAPLLSAGVLALAQDQQQTGAGIHIQPTGFESRPPAKGFCWAEAQATGPRSGP